MIDYTKNNISGIKTDNLEIDQNLRSYMLKIYNYMTLALALTGITAFFFGNSQAFLSLMYNHNVRSGQLSGISSLGYLIMFAPLIISFMFTLGLAKMSFDKAKILFWVYAISVGLSMSSIFQLYTGESIARTFFISSSIFGGMSLYGYSTKRDLTNVGSFLIMGLMGIFLTSIFNIFLKSSAVQFATSLLGTIIFIGFTAYDTQKIKMMYYQSNEQEDSSKIALMGAFNLYLDFINIFVNMLRFFGDRRND